MVSNSPSIKKLIEAKDYFAKENGHILYRDLTTGKLKVDYSKLKKDDNRNFISYTKSILKNSSLLNKAVDIQGFDYYVIITGGPNINKFDIENAKKRLSDKGTITDNLGDNNRDITEVRIKINRRK